MQQEDGIQNDNPTPTTSRDVRDIERLREEQATEERRIVAARTYTIKKFYERLKPETLETVLDMAMVMAEPDTPRRWSVQTHDVRDPERGIKNFTFFTGPVTLPADGSPSTVGGPGNPVITWYPKLFMGNRALRDHNEVLFFKELCMVLQASGYDVNKGKRTESLKHSSLSVVSKSDIVVVSDSTMGSRGGNGFLRLKVAQIVCPSARTHSLIQVCKILPKWVPNLRLVILVSGINDIISIDAERSITEGWMYSVAKSVENLIEQLASESGFLVAWVAPLSPPLGNNPSLASQRNYQYVQEIKRMVGKRFPKSYEFILIEKGVSFKMDGIHPTVHSLPYILYMIQQHFKNQDTGEFTVVRDEMTCMNFYALGEIVIIARAAYGGGEENNAARRAREVAEDEVAGTQLIPKHPNFLQDGENLFDNRTLMDPKDVKQEQGMYDYYMNLRPDYSPFERLVVGDKIDYGKNDVVDSTVQVVRRLHQGMSADMFNDMTRRPLKDVVKHRIGTFELSELETVWSSDEAKAWRKETDVMRLCPRDYIVAVMIYGADEFIKGPASLKKIKLSIRQWLMAYMLFHNRNLMMKICCQGSQPNCLDIILRKIRGFELTSGRRPTLSEVSAWLGIDIYSVRAGLQCKVVHALWGYTAVNLPPMPRDWFHDIAGIFHLGNFCTNSMPLNLVEKLARFKLEIPKIETVIWKDGYSSNMHPHKLFEEASRFLNESFPGGTAALIPKIDSAMAIAATRKREHPADVSFADNLKRKRTEASVPVVSEASLSSLPSTSGQNVPLPPPSSGSKARRVNKKRPLTPSIQNPESVVSDRNEYAGMTFRPNRPPTSPGSSGTGMSRIRASTPLTNNPCYFPSSKQRSLIETGRPNLMRPPTPRALPTAFKGLSSRKRTARSVLVPDAASSQPGPSVRTQDLPSSQGSDRDLLDLNEAEIIHLIESDRPDFDQAVGRTIKEIREAVTREGIPEEGVFVVEPTTSIPIEEAIPAVPGADLNGANTDITEAQGTNQLASVPVVKEDAARWMIDVGFKRKDPLYSEVVQTITPSLDERPSTSGNVGDIWSALRSLGSNVPRIPGERGVAEGAQYEVRPSTLSNKKRGTSYFWSTHDLRSTETIQVAHENGELADAPWMTDVHDSGETYYCLHCGKGLSDDPSLSCPCKISKDRFMWRGKETSLHYARSAMSGVTKSFVLELIRLGDVMDTRSWIQLFMGDPEDNIVVEIVVTDGEWWNGRLFLNLPASFVVRPPFSPYFLKKEFQLMYQMSALIGKATELEKPPEKLFNHRLRLPAGMMPRLVSCAGIKQIHHLERHIKPTLSTEEAQELGESISHALRSHGRYPYSRYRYDKKGDLTSKCIKNITEVIADAKKKKLLPESFKDPFSSGGVTAKDLSATTGPCSLRTKEIMELHSGHSDSRRVFIYYDGYGDLNNVGCVPRGQDVVVDITKTIVFRFLVTCYRDPDSFPGAIEAGPTNEILCQVIQEFETPSQSLAYELICQPTEEMKKERIENAHDAMVDCQMLFDIWRECWKYMLKFSTQFDMWCTMSIGHRQYRNMLMRHVRSDGSVMSGDAKIRENQEETNRLRDEWEKLVCKCRFDAK